MQPKFDCSEMIVRENWEKLLEDFGQFENKLQKRIEAKMDEISGLRDGVPNTLFLSNIDIEENTVKLTVNQLFNATNLLEASKSTSMNRYVMIFTVVTIIYLPLGLVTVSAKPAH